MKRIIILIYELRTYWAAPGKSEELIERFRSLTIGIFKRCNIEVVGFWTTVPETEESGTLVYLLRFDSIEAKEEAWNIFRQDPEWQQGKAASEVNGVLTARLVSTILSPTEFSPLQ